MAVDFWSWQNVINHPFSSLYFRLNMDLRIAGSYTGRLGNYNQPIIRGTGILFLYFLSLGGSLQALDPFCWLAVEGGLSEFRRSFSGRFRSLVCNNDDDDDDEDEDDEDDSYDNGDILIENIWQ